MIDRRIVLLLAFLNFIIISLCLTVIVRDKFQELGTHTEIVKIKASRDSLLRLNMQLLEKSRDQEERAVKLRKQIDQSTSAIVTLKEKRNEKVNQLDTICISGLIRFFTEFQAAHPPE